MSSPKHSSLLPAMWGVLGMVALGLAVAGTTSVRMAALRGQTSQGDYTEYDPNGYPVDGGGGGDQTVYTNDSSYDSYGQYSSQQTDPGYCCMYFQYDPQDQAGEMLTDEDGNPYFNIGTDDAMCNPVVSHYECSGYYSGLFYVEYGEFYDPLDPTGTAYDSETACQYSCIAGRQFTPKPPNPSSDPSVVFPYSYSSSYSSYSASSRSAAPTSSTSSRPPSVRPIPPIDFPTIDPEEEVYCCKPNGNTGIDEHVSPNWQVLTYEQCVFAGYSNTAVGVVAGTVTDSVNPEDIGLQCSPDLPTSCSICDYCGGGGILSSNRCTKEKCELLGLNPGEPPRCMFDEGWFWSGDCLPSPEFMGCGGDICSVCETKTEEASCNAVGGGGYCSYYSGTWYLLWLDAGCDTAGRCAAEAWFPSGVNTCVKRRISDTKSIGFRTESDCLENAAVTRLLRLSPTN